MPRATKSANGLARESIGASSVGPALVLEDLHKAFGAQKVLNGVDLTLDNGKTLAILGRSGTGKSVLLKLIIRAEAGLRFNSHPREGHSGFVPGSDE